jgi:CDP-diacylglycerol--glycerol-3-phosphate 3-phosphatidyltransferase
MSLLVSYIRARAEGMGLQCEVGLFTRAERIILLALGLLLSQIGDALLIILAVIAAFSLLTVVQRLHHVWRQTKTG